MRSMHIDGFGRAHPLLLNGTHFFFYRKGSICIFFQDKHVEFPKRLGRMDTMLRLLENATENFLASYPMLGADSSY